jgi:hypothetical protein
MSGTDSTADAPETKSTHEYKRPYNSLHNAEKKQLLDTATSMKQAVDALMLLVMGQWGYYKRGFEAFAAHFDDATTHMRDIYAEIHDAHMYYYGPKTQAWCRSKLDEGMWHLEAAKAKMEKAGRADQVAQIMAAAVLCKQCLDAYASAWSAILLFDQNNTFAFIQRRRGHHAFEPAPHPDVADMRLLLQQMQALSASR